MRLYDICLLEVITMENSEHDHLPCTIQEDIINILKFKRTLLIAQNTKLQIDEKDYHLDDMRYNLEQIENGMLWGRGGYEEHEEFEIEIERMEQEKQDLEMLLGNCEADVLDVKKDIVSKIDSKVLSYLEHIHQY